MSLFFCILFYEMRLSYRHRSEMTVPFFFFILIVCLFPLAVSPHPKTLQQLAPAVIWIAALLGTLLGLNRLFYADFQEGSLESLLLSPYPLPCLILAKIIAHWLVTSIPILLITPFLAYSFYLPAQSTLWLWVGLLIGTPTLSLIGAMGVSFTLGLRHGGMLLSLLALPLYIPILIFGISLVGGDGQTNLTLLAWLGAFLFLSLPLCPWVTAAAFRWSV